MRFKLPTITGRLGFLAGVLAAAILMPATVIAATSLVRIQSGSGTTTANVDGAHQLLVAESDPRSFLTSGYLTVSNGSCSQLVAPITGKALMVTQLRLLTRASPSFDASHAFVMWTNSTCNGADVLILYPMGLGNDTETFEPALPGSGVSAELFGSGLVAESSINGYTVPSAAAP
jgi:hypothetical protein